MTLAIIACNAFILDGSDADSKWSTGGGLRAVTYNECSCNNAGHSETLRDNIEPQVERR